MYIIKSEEIEIILNALDEILAQPDPHLEFYGRDLVAVLLHRCCDTLPSEFPYTALTLLPLKKWDKFSGDIHWPVPSVDQKTHEEAWMDSTLADPPYIWNKDHPYGKLVHESHLFLRDYLKKLAKDQSEVLVKDHSFKEINPTLDDMRGDYAEVSRIPSSLYQSEAQNVMCIQPNADPYQHDALATQTWEFTITEEDLKKAHKHATKNRQEILRSDVCACFYCLAYSQPNEITDWWDDDAQGVGQTAVCPKCGIDSMIGSAAEYPMDKGFIEEMRRYFFW